MKKRFVAIGASAASIAFITKLRSVDADCDILCISGEAELPYNRCFLADYLSQDTTGQEMRLKPDDFFNLNNITLRLGTWVTKIDTLQNAVFIGDEQIAYDYLFIGVGTKPFIPNIGVDRSCKEIFTFHTASDITGLSVFIDTHPAAHVVVVGGGLNGLECAASLQSRGVAVTIIERSSKLLPAQIDEQGADYVALMAVAKGIKLVLGQTVFQLCFDENKLSGVKLQSNMMINADAVVFTTGSVVHSELLEGTGIATEQGSILVDATMKTNIANVFAGGDICMVRDAMTKELVKSATWADAMLQGLCAATGFSDRPRQYPGYVGLRDSVFFGYEFYACGQTVGLDMQHVQEVRIVSSESMNLFYIKDGKLVGFVLFGDVSKIAQYKQWYMTFKAVVKDDFLV